MLSQILTDEFSRDIQLVGCGVNFPSHLLKFLNIPNLHFKEHKLTAAEFISVTLHKLIQFQNNELKHKLRMAYKCIAHKTYFHLHFYILVKQMFPVIILWSVTMN